MHYLITGGCGFIGSHLAHRLIAQGHSVTVIDDLSTGKRENLPPHIPIAIADITTPHAYDALLPTIDGCFHLAAIVSVQRSQDEWLRTHQVNLGGTVALFDAMARLNIKRPVVFASSAAVYGNLAELPQTESAACTPLSPYGTDKLACEFYARIASNMYGIPTAAMRFFNVYGPKQDASSPYSGVISLFRQRMKTHQPITIYGDGEQSRDFIYVGDVAAALDAAMQALQNKALHHGIFNVCTGHSTTINDLYNLMANILQTRSARSHGPARTGEVRNSTGDTASSLKTLNFKAQTPLREGLLHTITEA